MFIRDEYGRFKSPYFPSAPLKQHTNRDTSGRFAKVVAAPAPKYPNRDAKGRFLSLATVKKAKNWVAPKLSALTVADVIDAIEANGYKQIRGDYVRYDSEGYVSGGCAIGQGAINLGVGSTELYTSLKLIRNSTHFGSTLGDRIINLNDGKRMGIPTIVKTIRAEYADVLNRKVVLGANHKEYKVRTP